MEDCSRWRTGAATTGTVRLLRCHSRTGGPTHTHSGVLTRAHWCTIGSYCSGAARVAYKEADSNAFRAVPVEQELHGGNRFQHSVRPFAPLSVVD